MFRFQDIRCLLVWAAKPITPVTAARLIPLIMVHRGAIFEQAIQALTAIGTSFRIGNSLNDRREFIDRGNPSNATGTSTGLLYHLVVTRSKHRDDDTGD